jgi:hypothetical protein
MYVFLYVRYASKVNLSELKKIKYQIKLILFTLIDIN